MKENYILVFGEEGFLKAQLLKNFKQEHNVKEMFFDVLIREKFDAEEFENFAGAYPLLAPKRICIYKNTNIFNASEDISSLLSDKDAYVIFIENKVDKRKVLYKWFNKNGTVIECKKQTARELQSFVINTASEMGTRISTSAASYLIEVCGNDMYTLYNEIQKLSVFEEITGNIINEYGDGIKQGKIFGMLDAIGNKDTSSAIVLYEELLSLREPAMKILFMITKHISTLSKISRMKQKSNSEIAKIVQPFLISKYKEQSKNFEDFVSALNLCQETDYKIKSGLVKDYIGVELLIAELTKTTA